MGGEFPVELTGLHFALTEFVKDLVIVNLLMIVLDARGCTAVAEAKPSVAYEHLPMPRVSLELEALARGAEDAVQDLALPRHVLAVPDEVRLGLELFPQQT